MAFAEHRVQVYIEQVMKAATERAIVSRETLTVELEEARKLAIKVEQAAPAVSATMGKAKLHGLDVNKHEHAGPGGGPIPMKIEMVIVDPQEDEAEE